MPFERALLRTKLLTWLTVPLALLLTADTSVSYWIALDFSRRAYDHSLREIAREVSLHIRSDGNELALDLPDAAREVLFNDPSDRIYHEIVSPDGRLIAGEPIPRPRPAATLVPGKESLYDATLGGVPVRVVELAVQAQGAAGTTLAVVRIAETEVKRRILAREILLSVVVPQILLILIVGLVVWIGVVHGLAPLQKVQRAVASRSPYDRSPVTMADVPGEVRPMLESINGLLERLDSVMTLQSRFIADAAHQLKTPVAALQAQLELAARESDPQRQRESLNAMEAGLERLSRLVSQLLALARNEPEAASAANLKPLDLNELAFSATSAWVPEALKKQIDLGFEGCTGGLWIQADPERIHELFNNLLDNAVRYTRNGGQVTVRVVAAPCPTVHISDDGPIIPLEERQRVFDRFHRLLESPGEGSGLGLAIAQEIARIHGAEIRLTDDTDGVGNTFSVLFPPAKAPESA